MARLSHHSLVDVHDAECTRFAGFDEFNRDRVEEEGARAWIEQVDPDDATGKLKELYERAAAAGTGAITDINGIVGLFNMLNRIASDLGVAGTPALPMR